MLFALLFLHAEISGAAELITHQGVTAQVLSINVVRSIFGMRQAVWPDGTPVRVFVLQEQHAVHDAFCKEILNVYPYQLRQSWNRLVYSGTGQAPTEVASEQEMLARVATTPGAIGYVNKVTSNEPVHVIPVR
jgi:ABC-type phosphate transport system substrate-binding protein